MYIVGSRRDMVVPLVVGDKGLLFNWRPVRLVAACMDWVHVAAVSMCWGCLQIQYGPICLVGRE